MRSCRRCTRLLRLTGRFFAPPLPVPPSPAVSFIGFAHAAGLPTCAAHTIRCRFCCTDHSAVGRTFLLRAQCLHLLFKHLPFSGARCITDLPCLCTPAFLLGFTWDLCLGTHPLHSTSSLSSFSLSSLSLVSSLFLIFTHTLTPLCAHPPHHVFLPCLFPLIVCLSSSLGLFLPAFGGRLHLIYHPAFARTPTFTCHFCRLISTLFLFSRTQFCCKITFRFYTPLFTCLLRRYRLLLYAFYLALRARTFENASHAHARAHFYAEPSDRTCADTLPPHTHMPRALLGAVALCLGFCVFPVAVRTTRLPLRADLPFCRNMTRARLAARREHCRACRRARRRTLLRLLYF